MVRTAGRLAWAAVLILAAGCAEQGGPKKVQLSGTVTFKGKPVPAGYVSFMPDVVAGNAQGEVRVLQIKDGKFNSAEEQDAAGIYPGPNIVRVAGFDGKPLKLFPQGKQIFNPWETKATVTDGAALAFTVPAEAAANLRIEPTSDEP
jgi:hypothetical protein